MASFHEISAARSNNSRTVRDACKIRSHRAHLPFNILVLPTQIVPRQQGHMHILRATVPLPSGQMHILIAIRH
jgi:hypothetical protein